MIEKLLIAGFKVIIAAEGDQKILLQSAFPSLEIVHLNGYKLKYGSTKLRTLLKIIFQIPKILTAINRENRWLRSFIKSNQVDIVIADNRFGLHNTRLISVFITHQLSIKTSLGGLTDTLVQKMNYHFINQFSFCWVPDAEGEINLAGELSHPAAKPAIPVFYTGVLSRINKEAVTVTSKLLVLLSGPEPQRSILEKNLLNQLAQHNYSAIVVRGLPAAAPIVAPDAAVVIYNHLPGIELQRVINEAGIVISRAGYSTIMDLLPLGKKCILIPTPGQAEQEYLATWLEYKKYACIGFQHNFSLPLMLEKAAQLQTADLAFLKTPGKIDEAIAAIKKQLDASDK